MTYITQ